MEPSRQQHNIDPVWAPDSRVLILGSFPSVKSREAAFFYGHPQNRFWKVLAAVLGEPVPADVPAKKAMLLRRRIALWDVIASCTIIGSSDASIRDAVPNDVGRMLAASQISAIFCNGRKSSSLYNTYLRDSLGMEAVCLPSTSPANARWTLDKLINTWGTALAEALGEDKTPADPA